jgi:hypothetical protein
VSTAGLCVRRKNLGTRVAGERAATADLLADIAEFDARRLFAPAGYDSMFAYCLKELQLSDDAATLRIRAARAALFPVIFPALAEGRLNLSVVYLLSRRLTADNGQDLLAAAMDKTKAEVQLLLAERFPQPDLPSRITALPPQPGGPTGSPVPERVNGHAPGPMASPHPWPKVAPLSPGRFSLQETIAQDTHEKLRYAQALLGHAVPSGAVAEVIDRALDALIAQLEKQKFAATVDGIRLRCRAHNLFEAECVFGAGFMSIKREARARAAIENDPERSVIPWLRKLGFRLQDAREAALICERMNGASMEEQIRAALRYIQ